MRWSAHPTTGYNLARVKHQVGVSSLAEGTALQVKQTAQEQIASSAKNRPGGLEQGIRLNREIYSAKRLTWLFCLLN